MGKAHSTALFMHKTEFNVRILAIQYKNNIQEQKGNPFTKESLSLSIAPVISFLDRNERKRKITSRSKATKKMSALQWRYLVVMNALTQEGATHHHKSLRCQAEAG